MLLAHLVHDSALHFATERLSLIKVTHQSELSGRLEVIYMVLLVLALQELVQKRQSLILLHRAGLKPVCEVVHLGFVFAFAPDLGLEDLDIERAARISKVRLNDVFVKLFQLIQFV